MWSELVFLSRFVFFHILMQSFSQLTQLGFFSPVICLGQRCLPPIGRHGVEILGRISADLRRRDFAEKEEQPEVQKPCRVSGKVEGLVASTRHLGACRQHSRPKTYR